MTYKQNTKMKAEGNHYKAGGKVKKYEDGGSVSNAPKKLSLLDENTEWVKQNYPEFHKALTEAIDKDGGVAPKNTGSRSRGGSGGGGSGAADLDMEGMMMRKPNPALKKGGKVKRGKISK